MKKQITDMTLENYSDIILDFITQGVTELICGHSE